MTPDLKELERLDTGNGLDATSIHPKKGAKYSPNLYKWLNCRAKNHRTWTSRVYRDIDGVLWIGMLDLGHLIGARLTQVLCYGHKAESYCFVNLKGLVEVEDFWSRYVADGRCAIDTEHTQYFIGDDTQWTVDGDSRACLWCGKVNQVLARWTKTVECKEWRNAAIAKEQS